MIVALDATPLSLTSGGLRRYTAELSAALAHEYPEDRFWLLSGEPFKLPEPAAPNLVAARGPRNALERRWWAWGVQRALASTGAAVFHGTNFEVPLCPTRPSVVTVFDLSPWMDPSWHDGAARVRRRAPAALRLGLATMVLTATEAVRREVIRHFGLHPSRVVAVPLAAPAGFKRVSVQTQAPYLLYAGTLEPRKNIGVAIEAWRTVRARHPEIELVLAGRRREDCPPINPEPGLCMLGEVAEEALPGLYSGALACLYPSLYEGFGLPVLEAMQCGAAVIASRDPAVMEVSGGAAIHVDAADVRGWAEALESMLHAPARQAWGDRAAARATQFSWAQTARLTREVYAEAVARFGR